MGYDAKVIKYSVAPHGGRLLTMEWTYPRVIHSEFMTHRDRARNSASSRAIPIEKMIQRAIDDPYIPDWTSKQKGMQGGDALNEHERHCCDVEWLAARDHAVKIAKHLSDMGVHKQDANRLLEPFAFHTVVVTATTWANLFKLRCHPKAHPAFQKVACMARDLLKHAQPQPLDYGQWHLPYLTAEDIAEIDAMYDTREQATAAKCQASAAKCARTSYLTHDNVRDVTEDIRLYNDLTLGLFDEDEPLHGSPMEHVAQAASSDTRSGPFVGFRQLRKTLPRETCDLYVHEGWSIT